MSADGNSKHYTAKLERGTAFTVESYRRSHTQHSKVVQDKYIINSAAFQYVLRKTKRLKGGF